MQNESPQFREYMAAHVERLAAMYPMLEAGGIGIVDGDAHPCEEYIRLRTTPARDRVVSHDASTRETAEALQPNRAGALTT